MPNRLPGCPVCGPRKRHLPETCPVLSMAKEKAATGIRNGLNDIPGAVATLKKAISILEGLQE